MRERDGRHTWLWLGGVVQQPGLREDVGPDRHEGVLGVRIAVCLNGIVSKGNNNTYEAYLGVTKITTTKASKLSLYHRQWGNSSHYGLKRSQAFLGLNFHSMLDSGCIC